ncbi:uncharacterized protein T551_03188 [Pneumocystis jirovecii RU7]|uniref:Uncharacterized protein n=1 Tax=Pneumocystis jirovecii (strain RU7) TaxID=1408657 RepID=A0A0W4ZFU2_PNEJ7|nr:uncharacterized protein T551_03188 [Pneumocystis jirovecii RU7]KTW27194.1 hypothetical protein T551_03188 [Pneumocystis jirovecii RU7]
MKNIVSSKKTRISDQEISCSEGEDDPWSDNKQEFRSVSVCSTLIEQEKTSEKTIEKRQFRKRRPEQKRPYTYDLLKHREEFRKLGIKPMTSMFLDHLDSGNSDSQYTSEDSEDSYMSLAHAASESQDSEIFKWFKSNAKFINPNRHNWRLKRTRKFLQKQLSSSSNNSEEISHISSYNSETMIDTIAEPFQNSDDVIEVKDKEYHSENNISNTSTLSLSNYSPSISTGRNSKIKSILLNSVDIDIEKSDSHYEQSLINDISHYKKKLKGILPPSYLTLENRFITSNIHSKENAFKKKKNFQEKENKKGLVKRKMAKFPPVSESFLTIMNTENLSGESERINNLNFTEDRNDHNLSSQSSDNNSALEKKLINRMYAKTRVLNSYLDLKKRRKKDNIYKKDLEKSLEYMLPRKKIKKKLNNFSHVIIRKRPAIKIGILDIFKKYKDKNHQIFPKFINLACRIMKSRKDLGRCYPYKKFFFFDNIDDRHEVNEIFRKWKQGILTPVYLKNDIFSSYVKSKIIKDSGDLEGKKSSVSVKDYEAEQNIENSNKKSKKIIGKMLFQRGLQKKLTDNFIKRQNNHCYGKKSYERYNTIGVFKSIYDWLDKLSLYKLNIDRADTNIEKQKDNSTLKLRKYHNIRKSTAKRIDSNHFDDTIIHRYNLDETNVRKKTVNDSFQQSLKQFFLKNSAFSMSFNVNPIKQGIFFASETFIGNGLLRKLLLESDNSAEESLYCIESYTIFNYEIQNDLPNDIKKIQKVFEEFSYNVLEYNIQNSKKKDIANCPLYSFLFYIFRYITFWLQKDVSGLLIDFSKNLLESCENLSEQLISSVQFCRNFSIESVPVKFFFQLQMFSLIFAFQFTRLYFTKNISKFHDMCNTIISISQRLIKYLLQLGFDSLSCKLKKQNNPKYLSKGISNEDYFIEVWVVTIHIIDFSNTLFGQSISNFWTLLNSELNSSEIYEFLSHEKCWYSVMNIVLLYQFNLSGVSYFPNGPDNWSMIEKKLSIFFENTEIFKKELGNTQDAYIRTLFGRCHYLISTWKWSYSKSIVILLYTFFSKRQLRNLLSENLPGYPRFIENLNTIIPTSIETYDTCFHIFLKLIILVIDQLKIQSDDFFIFSKDLRILISRIIPLHNRKYSNDQELSIEDFISLENHHSLLLILFRAVPCQYRPPIVMIQDLVQIENAHCKARLVNIKAWLYLTHFLLYNSNNDEFQAVCSWYDLVLDTTREEYLSIYRAHKFQLDLKTLKCFSNNKLLKYNLKQLENVMISCLTYKKEIIDLENNNNREKILQLFSKASSINLFNFSSIIPNSVVIEALNLTSSFIRKLSKKRSYKNHNEHVNDSQDYGDISIFYDLIDECDLQDNIEYQFSMIINKTLSGQIFQMLSNYLGSDIEISYELLNAIIECWVLIADLLVRNGIKEWSNYLDYGQESWIRFGNNSKVNQTGVIFMSKVIKECPNAYFAYRVTFISYWFRAIVEDKLYDQHILTSLILNIDSCNKLWKNPPFIKKSGFFQIQLFEIKLCQLSIISNTLANMGEIYSHLISENSIQSTKSEFLTYLSNLFHSMRENYQKLIQKKDNDIEKYIGLCQKLIGNVLQYCGEFVNENSLPILEWFTDSTNFPQPEEDIIYTAKKLKGYERRNLHNPIIQEELFRFVKAKCETALFENKRSKFSTLMCFVLDETKNNINVEIQTMNLISFILDEIFTTYIIYSKSHITWIYIIPMLEATQELFTSFLRYKYQNSNIYSILNIMESFFNVLLSCLKTFFESSTLLAVYGSAKIFEILAVSVEFLESLSHTSCLKSICPYIFENKCIEHLWEYVSNFLKLVPIFVLWISSRKKSIRWPDLYIVETQKKQLATIQRQIHREWVLKDFETEYTWFHNFRNQEIKLISGFNEEKIKQLLLKGVFNFVLCLFSCGGTWELRVKEIIPSIFFEGLLIDQNVIIEFMASIGKLHEYNNICRNKHFEINNTQVIQHSEYLDDLFI